MLEGEDGDEQEGALFCTASFLFRGLNARESTPCGTMYTGTRTPLLLMAILFCTDGTQTASNRLMFGSQFRGIFVVSQTAFKMR